MDLLIEQLIQLGTSKEEANIIFEAIQHGKKKSQAEQQFKELTKKLDLTHYPFDVYKLIYEKIYLNWDKIPAPVWFPNAKLIEAANITHIMRRHGFKDYQAFHLWSVTHYPEFWQEIIDHLNIQFDSKYKTIVDLSEGVESPRWFPNSKLNIVNSCFNAKETDIAIIERMENGDIKKTSYGELNQLSNRVANSISSHHQVGDRIAIIMPMTMEAIAIYLGIIKAGCCVVSIADSFAANEIASRLNITNVKAVFSQVEIMYDGKHIPLYEKIIDANAPTTILVSREKKWQKNLRKQDISWKDYLSDDEVFTTVSCHPEDHINILFSSGTTADPKAIPWTHTTPIKCGSDAFFHHDIQAGDILCWPTNLGWMMGPWTIFACLLNKSTLALYNDTPNARQFGEFIQNNKISILGLIPTHVKKWRKSACMEGLDWSAIKLLSSTAECSNIEDMLYLTWLSHHRPIIEYCGGTEIGGAYITGTIIQPCAPSAFTGPALGIDFIIIDEYGFPADKGEVALIPPSLGLSTEILNKNHHEIYYANMRKQAYKPLLRRHGDCVERYKNGFYRLRGRIDDTMSLGGIKVSSIEIESVLNKHPQVIETAAIAINPPGGGACQLIIYVLPNPNERINTDQLKIDLQKMIKESLNPIFKIHDVILIELIPRTASNKIMRRILIGEYEDKHREKSKSTKKKNTKKICLALQGGGAYGAYTWGILDKLLEDERIEIDSISATSAGSINAVLVADGMSKGGNEGARHALRDFWHTLGQYGNLFSPIKEILPLIETDLSIDFMAQTSFILFDLMTRMYSPYILNPLNFDLMRLILNDKIDFKNLKRNEIKLFLSATNVKTGMLKVFENADITVDAILASACLPYLRQAVQINGEYYWDGGYLGNPAIYPLIYNSQVDDILIIHNNPITRDTVPISSTDIANRENEISFNSSLIRELRTIAFITKLIDKGWIKDEYKENIRRKFLHIIRSDEAMNQYSIINKFNFHSNFINHLRDTGHEAAAKWLKVNFDHIGKKPTIDFSDFLAGDTQTT